MVRWLLPCLVACGPNEGPVITSLALDPERPSVAGPVRCVGEASDPDGDALTWTWSWTRNGEPAGDGEVLSGPFVADDVLVCTATAKDGRGGSATRDVDGWVGVGNTDVLAARIVPDPVHADDAVSVEVDVTDPDGSPDLLVRWWVNAVQVAEGPGTALPSTVGFTRGDLLQVQVVGNGSVRAPVDDETTVVNSPPRLDLPVIQPGIVRATGAVTASVAVTDVDGDLVTQRWRWTRTRDGAVFVSGERADPALPLPIQRGDRIFATVDASDGEAMASASSAEVTVANVPPAIGGVQVGDGSGEGTPSQPLRCRVFAGAANGGFDDDGDPVTFEFTWENLGVPLAPGLATTSEHPGDTLPVGLHRVGDVWTCTVVASDGVDTSPPVAATAVVSCRVPLLAAHPADTAFDVSVRPVITLAFSEDVSDDTTVSLVSRTTGMAHPLVQDPVWSSDGRHVWIGPVWPLTPRNAYEVRMETACGVSSISFTTGVSTGPQVVPADLSGRTWAVDFGSGFTVHEPMGADALLSSLLFQLDVRMVLVPTAWDPATSALTVELGGHNGGGEQERCLPTVPLPAADGGPLPFVVLDAPGRTELTSLTDDFVVHDLHLQGTLTTRARGLTSAHVRGVVDVETLMTRVGPLLGVQTAEEACNLLFSFGLGDGCEPCPDHGRASCVPFFLDDLTLVDLALPAFELRTEADVAADPECAGSQAGLCACASTDPRAGLGALVLLALGLRRRRA